MNFQQAVAPPRSKSSSYLSQYGTLSHTPNNKLSRKNGCRDRSVDSLVVKASQGESGTATAAVSNTSASSIVPSSTGRFILLVTTRRVLSFYK